MAQTFTRMDESTAEEWGQIGVESAKSQQDQGETVLAWDLDTGRPLTPAIVWQDRRAEGICAELRAGRPEDDAHHRQRDDPAHGKRGQVLGAVGDERVDGTEEPQGERALPDLHRQLPHHPCPGHQPDEQRREVVGGEALLRIAGHRSAARRRNAKPTYFHG